MSESADVLRPALVADYFDAANDERLVVPACADCGETHFPPRVVCPYCLSSEVTLQESNGRGRVYSFTVIRGDSHPTRGSAAPYVVALVDLDDGPIVFTGLVDCDLDSLSVGMAVDVRFDRLDGEQRYPVFTPVDHA